MRSRPGFVPSPIPTIMAAMTTTVRSVMEETRATRVRRFIASEIRSDREREYQSLIPPLARGWCVRVGRAVAAADEGKHVVARAVLGLLVEEIVAGRHALEDSDIRIVVDSARLSPVTVVPDV